MMTNIGKVDDGWDSINDQSVAYPCVTSTVPRDTGELKPPNQVHGSQKDVKYVFTGVRLI
jgi:hypothetical protein